MEIIDEKRRSVRTKTRIPVYWRIVDEKDRSRLSALIHSQPSSNRVVPGVVSSPSFSSARLRELDIALIQILQDISRKLDAIMDHLGIAAKKGESVNRGQTIDLSGSGVRFNGSLRVNRGDLLELSMEIPDRETIGLLAEVVSVKPSAGDPEKKEVACNFIAVNEADKRIIVEYCDSLRQERPKFFPHRPVPRM